MVERVSRLQSAELQKPDVTEANPEHTHKHRRDGKQPWSCTGDFRNGEKTKNPVKKGHEAFKTQPQQTCTVHTWMEFKESRTAPHDEKFIVSGR